MPNLVRRRLNRRTFLQTTAITGLAACGLTTTASAGTPDQAGTPLTPQQAVERLLSSDAADAAWFAPSFLSQVSLAQVQAILDQLKSTLGDFQQVQSTDSGLVAVYSLGTIPVKFVQLDGQGRFTALQVGMPQFAGQGLDQAVSALQALPGQVSLLVRRNGESLVNLNPDAPLAVGSSFKLAVLTELRSQIEAGQRAWKDVVALHSKWKSLASGILQNWPDGSLLTLQALASLMISQSDNTATDSLIRLLGREKVGAVAPDRNRPFMTTREAFVLKDPANAALHDQYLSGDSTQRLAALQQADALPLPDVNTARLLSGPVATDIEWFFTTGELCDLMSGLTDLPLMGIDPGVADAQQWSRIAYKGGQEAGVLNMTYGLQNAAGDAYLASVTWNNDATDLMQFALLVGQLLAALS